MILSISNTKKIVLLFSIFHFLFSIEIQAQTTPGIDPNNLSTVRIDELSDEQVMSIVKQGEAAGLTIEQAQSMAVKRGLPTSEVQKLKDRIAKIQSQSKLKSIRNNSNVQDSIMHLNDKELNVNNELERNFQDSIKGKKIVKSTIYGQDFFRNGDIKIFDKSTDAKAPANYVIGIGDELGVSVFGFSYYNEVLKVDSRGAINPSQMGPIFIKGLTYDRAKLLIRSKMGQYFDLSNNKLEIILSYSRSITVNIVGEVTKPGSYKIPAINTAFNALILAGGPNDIGTMRNIQIRRDGKVVKTLDVYSFLNDPNSKQDFYLEDNDYILVGSLNKLVKLNGEVNRAAYFELLNTEGFNSLLKYAGGFKQNAYKDKIQVLRRSSIETKILDVNIDSLRKINKDFTLENGDEVVVISSISVVLNKVKVNGAINFAGDYNIGKSDRVLDLIKKGGGLKQEANRTFAYLVRNNQDQTREYYRINLKEILSDSNSSQNMLLQTLDVLTIYSNKDYVEPFTVELFGAVRIPGKLGFANGMTLGDALQNVGGLRLEAENLRIEVSRLNYFSNSYVDGQDVRIIIERIQLSSNYSFLNDTDAKMKLQPFDQIFVRTIPNYMLQQNITISGEVKFPGVYSLLSKEEHIDQVISRAGGVSRFAFTEAATLYRPELPGKYIVIKLNEVLRSKNSKYNYALKSGDILNIPTVTDFVIIKGSGLEYLALVDSPQINAPFVFGRRAKYYIKEFGNGFTKEAWRKKTYVVQPNAKINRTRNFGLFKIYPKVTKGSAIYVENKVKKEKQLNKEKEPFNWNKFIENSMVKFTGIATLYILFKQLK